MFTAGSIRRRSLPDLALVGAVVLLFGAGVAFFLGVIGT